MSVEIFIRSSFAGKELSQEKLDKLLSRQTHSWRDKGLRDGGLYQEPELIG